MLNKMIILDNITFTYPQKKIFVNTNLEVKEGEFVFLVGESGIGKTTLLKLIYFDLFPEKGIVKLNNFSSKTIHRTYIPRWRREIGIVFQDFKIFYDRNVFENLAVPLFISGAKGDNVKKT